MQGNNEMCRTVVNCAATDWPQLALDIVEHGGFIGHMGNYNIYEEFSSRARLISRSPNSTDEVNDAEKPSLCKQLTHFLHYVFVFDEDLGSFFLSFPFPFVPLQRRGCLVAPSFL
jgi:hypothetical protein